MSPPDHRLMSPDYNATQNDQAKEVLKWTRNCAHDENIASVKVNQCSTGDVSTGVSSHIVKVESGRAKPNNPIMYKALRNVKIRCGRNIDTDVIGTLQKGSIVTINQVKGRSGRIVVQQENGEYTKLGWVTLYTTDKQQLLVKRNSVRWCSE